MLRYLDLTSAYYLEHKIMSSQSSHATDSKNKNLLAAKASLGLSTAGSTSSSRRNEPTKSTSLHSVSSSVSGSTLHSHVSSRKYPGSAQEEARRFSSNLSAASSSYRSNTPVKSTSLHSVSSSVSGGSSRKFPASAQEDAQRFTSSLHTDNDSYASSRYGQRLPTSQQIDETIEVGSVDDSMAGDSMIGSSTYSTSSNKKSKRNNNATRDSDGIKKTSTLESNSSLFTSQSSTSEFSTSFDNCYEKKVDYNETSLQSIQEDAHSIEEAHPVLHDSNANMSESGSDFYDSYAHSSQRSDFYDSNADISERSELEDSNNNMSERSELDYSNANLSQRSDLYESNGDISQRSDTQSHMSRDDFTPQRFDEMRTLLSAITPLQLEALMQEIFGKDGPPGWRFIGKKSKAKGFRKDAYLSEMSIEELQNFARRMDNLGLDYCTSNEEALDVIAIEFERLVTLHQNKDEESIRADSMQPQSSMNSMMSSNLMEDDQMTLDSGRTSRSDEPDNLRRSLRACSFPELRLVAERLHLDHSSCVTKGELIFMIENSMPDLVDATSQDSQSQMLLEDYNNYSEPTPRNSRDRRRKVKFSNDCKEDKSHLVSKRGSWQDNGQDIESSPLVKADGDKESPRFIVAFKRVWKAVAVLLLLALIIGLSVGLTAGKGSNDKKGSSSDALMPQNDPFFGFGDFYGSSRTSEPSLSPSQQNTDDESQPTSHNQGKPSSPSGGVVIIKRDPTAKPSVYSTQEFYKGSHMPTETDTTQLPSAAAQTKQPTLTPTIASLIETEKPIPVAQFSITNDQPMPTDQPITTAQPTPLSPYPLLGPFEETNMRMVVYGISELSQMGKTQFKMLTAAYVEQFYNEEGRGTDAIQNIVFDVAASIDITSVDPPPSRRLTRSKNRALQTDILIITFTMNLSYKTFSNAVDAKTVAERPFLEESMIDDYIEFLDENNAQKFVGNIEDVSSIFRGDDFPEIYYDVGGEENVIDNTRTPSFSPVATPVKLTPRPTIENTPEPSRKPTAKPITAVTPKPTLLVTPAPTERPIVSPTLSPTDNPTDKPTQSPTRKPTYKPTPGKVIHTYSPVKQVIHTYSPVAFRRMEEVQDSKES